MTKDNWQTPKELFNKLNDEFHFQVDVCASEDNTLCDNYFDEEKNAIVTDWYQIPALTPYPKNIMWMNPPYSRNNIAMFCKKAYEESQKGCIVVGLIKLDTSTTWFQNYIMNKAHEVRFCKKRISFIDPNTGKKGGSPPFASAIIVWKPTIPTETKFSMYEW